MTDPCYINAVNCHTKLINDLNKRLNEIENFIGETGSNGEVPFWGPNNEIIVDPQFFYNNETNTLYINNLNVENTINTSEINTNNIYVNDTLDVCNIQCSSSDGNILILSNILMDCNTTTFLNNIAPNPNCGPNINIQNGNLVLNDNTNLYVTNIYSSSSSNVININANVNLGNLDVSNLFANVTNADFANIFNLAVGNITTLNQSNIKINGNVELNCSNTLFVNHIQSNGSCENGNLMISSSNIIFPSSTNVFISNIYSSNTNGNIVFNNDWVIIQNLDILGNLNVSNISSNNKIVNNLYVDNIYPKNTGSNINILGNLEIECGNILYVNQIQANLACDNGNLSISSSNLIFPSSTNVYMSNIYSSNTDGNIVFNNNWVIIQNLDILGNLNVSNISSNNKIVNNLYVDNIYSKNSGSNINILGNVEIECDNILYVNQIQANLACDNGNLSISASNLIFPSSTNVYISNIYSSNTDGNIFFNNNWVIMPNLDILGNISVSNISSNNKIVNNLYVDNIYPKNPGSNINILGNVEIECNNILYVNQIQANLACDNGNLSISSSNLIFTSSTNVYMSNIYSSNTNGNITFINNWTNMSNVNILSNLISSNSTINNLYVDNIFPKNFGSNINILGNLEIECGNILYVNQIQSNLACDNGNLSISSSNLIFPSSTNVYISNIYSSNTDGNIFFNNNWTNISNVNILSNLISFNSLINNSYLDNIYPKNTGSNINILGNLEIECGNILYVNQIQANLACDNGNLSISASNLIFTSSTNVYISNIYSSNTDGNIFFNNNWVIIPNLDIIGNIVVSNISSNNEIVNNLYVDNIYSKNSGSNINILGNLEIKCGNILYVNQIQANLACDNGNLSISSSNLIFPSSTNVYLSNVYSSNIDGNIFFNNNWTNMSNVNISGNLSVSNISVSNVNIENEIVNNLIVNGTFLQTSNIQTNPILPEQQTFMSQSHVPYGASAIPSTIIPFIKSNPSFIGIGETSFNLKALYPDIGSFSGGVFDGSYIYFGTKSMNASANLRLIRCKSDTLNPYLYGNITNTANLFESIELPGYGGNAFLTGGFFDGTRYVHFVGSNINLTSGNVGLVSYDISKPFLNANSFIVQNPALINSDFTGNTIDGCIFDGSKLYLLPTGSSSNLFACTYNYSNLSTIFTSSSVSSYNISSAYYWNSITPIGLDANISNFSGGSFDGRFIYLSPLSSKMLVRFDTTQNNASSGFQTFPLNEVLNLSTPDFRSCVYDGKYVYFIPSANINGSTVSSTILRYDTTLDFSQTYSYSNIQLSTIQNSSNSSFVGFKGGMYDGKYIYLLPNQNSSNIQFANTILQYDTSKSMFDIRSNLSYRSLSLGSVDGNLFGFEGGVSDLKSIWLPPSANSNLVVLPTFSGSWSDNRWVDIEQYINSTTNTISNLEIMKFTNTSLANAPTSNACFNIDVKACATDLTSNYLGYQASYFIPTANITGIQLITPINVSGTVLTNTNFYPNIYVQRNTTSIQIVADSTGITQPVNYNFQIKSSIINQSGYSY